MDTNAHPALAQIKTARAARSRGAVQRSGCIGPLSLLHFLTGQHRFTLQPVFLTSSQPGGWAPMGAWAPTAQHYQQDVQARRYPSRQGVLVRTFLIHNCSEIRYALTAVESLCSQGTGFLLPQPAAGWSSWGSQSTGPCLRWSALYLLRWGSGNTYFYRSLLWGAASTENATSVLSRAGKGSKERKMAMEKNIGVRLSKGECLNGSWVEHEEPFCGLSCLLGRQNRFLPQHLLLRWNEIWQARTSTGPEHIDPSP